MKWEDLLPAFRHLRKLNPLHPKQEAMNENVVPIKVKVTGPNGEPVEEYIAKVQQQIREGLRLINIELRAEPIKSELSET